ncbi:hypothetical protein ACS0TY_020911 [Phlomoides rotata]
MKRVCELCKSMSRIHCESDQASLCWDCDAKVHSANFLVARHFRNLLCRVCRSPARWSASGPKVKPTQFLCRKCINARVCDESSEEDDKDETAEEIDENQFSAPSPESESSSSCESPFGGGEVVVSRKRCRLDNDRRV